MKIVQINSMDMFSTGNIMLNIARVARERGHTALTVSKKTKMSRDRDRRDPNHIYVGSRVENTIHRYFSWITDLQDYGTIFGTIKLIMQIDRLKPDLIHLHDVLGWYLNIGILFRYIKWKQIPVVWTFHDCWAFTGRCIYFDAAKCDRWKSGCGECPQIGYMPSSWYFDHSAWNFKRKRRLFTAISNLTIVTPSAWLMGLTRESFLSGFPIKVINNGIDINKFKPTHGTLYWELKGQNRPIVLGVAATWSVRKGLNDFLRLAEELGADYQFFIVGISSNDIPASITNIRCLARTHDVEELANIYSAAEVLLNPTYEDNFPTVNLESLACGTPVVTYRTGGSPESVTPKTGRVVGQGDFIGLKEAVQEVCMLGKEHFTENCLQQSRKYDMKDRFNDYIDLYERIDRCNNTKL